MGDEEEDAVERVNQSKLTGDSVCHIKECDCISVGTVTQSRFNMGSNKEKFFFQ